MKKLVFISILTSLIILSSCQKKNKQEQTVKEHVQEKQKVTEVDIVQKKEEPTELEMKIYKKLDYLMNRKEGNPNFEVTPANLSAEQYKQWSKEWMKRVDEYDKKQYEIVAKEFEITAEEAEKIYEKVTIFMMEKKSK